MLLVIGELTEERLKGFYFETSFMEICVWFMFSMATSTALLFEHGSRSAVLRERVSINQNNWSERCMDIVKTFLMQALQI